MLGKFLKRKKKGEGGQPTRPMMGQQLKLDEAPKRERKKREDAAGPSWGAMALLAMTMGAGLIFWIYGNLQTKGELGFEGLGRMTLMPEQAPWEIDESDDGVIIFENE